MEGLILMQYKSSSKFIFIELYKIKERKEKKKDKHGESFGGYRESWREKMWVDNFIFHCIFE